MSKTKMFEVDSFRVDMGNPGYKQVLGFSQQEYEELERDGHISMDYHPSILVRGSAKQD